MRARGLGVRAASGLGRGGVQGVQLPSVGRLSGAATDRLGHGAPGPRRARGMVRRSAVDGTDMQTRDLRIESIRPLIPPAILLEELPLSDASSQVVTRARDELVQILNGEDDRL